jgi:putative restriction endonuclease
LDRDWQIRLAAFDAIRRLKARSGDCITRTQLQEGFAAPGYERRIPFASRGAGIWRPEALSGSPGAALSLLTSLKDPYADQITPEGWLEYAYQSGPVDNAFNRSLRNAFASQRPLLYFKALEKGLYAIVEPVYIINDDPVRRIATLAVDASTIGMADFTHGGSPEALKRYATTTTLARLHQEQFRIDVIGAYARKCAVCRLGQEDRLVRLLDAAHILPDGDPRSKPVISNGLALCKIHHSAYDLNIVGIDPDHRVHVREDILAQIDGPMLQHGIKEMQGERIRVPHRPDHQPNVDYLAERFEAFMAA